MSAWLLAATVQHHDMLAIAPLGRNVRFPQISRPHTMNITLACIRFCASAWKLECGEVGERCPMISSSTWGQTQKCSGHWTEEFKSISIAWDTMSTPGRYLPRDSLQLGTWDIRRGGLFISRPSPTLSSAVISLYLSFLFELWQYTSIPPSRVRTRINSRNVRHGSQKRGG